MNEKNPIARGNQNEIVRPFAKYRELFDFAQRSGLREDSFSIYTGEYKPRGYQPIELPQEFVSLVEDYPGSYYVVAYDDRRDEYYKKGTNHRMVRLSTVPIKGETDDKITEIDMSEVDPSVGNHIEVAVRQSINNQSFEDLNTAMGTELDESYGSVELAYAVEQDGKKRPLSAKYARLDEGLFRFGDSDKPVRWVRDLEVEQYGDKQKLTYKDLYIMGRHSDRSQERRAEVRTHVTGAFSDPKSMLVEIGLGSPEAGRVLYENPTTKVKVIAHEQIGSYKGDIDVLRQDPLYSLILGESPNEQAFFSSLEDRIRLLQDEWDEPQTVYSSLGIEGDNEGLKKLE